MTNWNNKDNPMFSVHDIARAPIGRVNLPNLVFIKQPIYKVVVLGGGTTGGPLRAIETYNLATYKWDTI